LSLGVITFCLWVQVCLRDPHSLPASCSPPAFGHVPPPLLNEESKAGASLFPQLCPHPPSLASCLTVYSVTQCHYQNWTQHCLALFLPSLPQDPPHLLLLKNYKPEDVTIVKSLCGKMNHVIKTNASDIFLPCL
jgi:hypothetical protein